MLVFLIYKLQFVITLYCLHVSVVDDGGQENAEEFFARVNSKYWLKLKFFDDKYWTVDLFLLPIILCISHEVN